MGTRSLSIVQRLAMVGGAGLAAAILTGGAVVAVGRYHALNSELQSRAAVEMLVRELDTRASELKVDGYKAIVRPKPADEKSELAEDTETIIERLDKLRALPLTDAQKTEVAALDTAFDDYVRQIDAIVDAAIADPAKARAGWEKIQEANDATDTAVEKATETFGAATADTTADLERLGSRLMVVILMALAAAAVGVVGLAALFARAIGPRIRAFESVLTTAAEGDLSTRTGDRTGDEIGRMGRALDGMLDRLTCVFGTMRGAGQRLGEASERVQEVAAAVAGSSRHASGQAQEVAASASEVSRNVETVAAGAQEMSASIGEIARNAHEAAHVATDAVSAVEETTGTMLKLGESSKEIGDVIRLITSIAEQTNLLALNATIEAARAGDAGKGFAVVADEVKQLAQETARATEDISRRVQAIQNDAERASVAIGDISSVIARINEYQTTIAGAVEQQTATTQDMNVGINEAATGSNRIAEGVTGFATSAGEAATAMTETQHSADELRRMSDELLQAVSTFRL